jgi:hypothetical protein
MLRWTIPQAVLQNIWKDSFRCQLIRWSQYLSGGCLKGQLICYAQISTVRCLYSPSQLRKTHFEGRFRVQGPLHSPYTEPFGTRSGTIVKNHIQSRSTLTQWPAFLCSEYDTSLTNFTTGSLNFSAPYLVFWKHSLIDSLIVTVIISLIVYRNSFLSFCCCKKIVSVK